jgi:hypothetical protein
VAKVYTYTLLQETNFGQTKVAGGTVVANMVVENDCIDPMQIVTMAMYRQISVEVTDLDQENIPVVEKDLVLDREPNNVQSEGEARESGSESGDANEAPSDAPIKSDLHAILDEKIVSALESNGIDSQAKLREFIASGKDMSELDKIGPGRVKTIMAAISNNGLTPV